MRIKWSVFAVGALLALSAVSLAQRAEPNAFLARPANSIGELVAQAEKEPAVMARYMRHFGMTRDEVVAYLKTLRKGEIAEDGAYLVYNTPESGEIRGRVIVYRKGTSVWVDKDGNYILKSSCGNPMVRGTDLGKTQPTETTALRSSTDVRELIVEQPPGISTTSVTGTTVAPPIAEYDAIVIADMPPAMPEEAPQGLVIPPVLGLIIPFTGAVMLGSEGGPEPIPEPASMIALGVGVTGYMAARKRRKQTA
jgi:hypothetical protein